MAPTEIALDRKISRKISLFLVFKRALINNQFYFKLQTITLSLTRSGILIRLSLF